MLRILVVFWFFQNNNLEHSSTLCCYTFHLAFDSEEIYVWILILLSTCKILKQLKIKCKFSFLLEVLLSCSNVKINPQNKKIKLQTFKKKEKKKIIGVYQTSHLPEPGVPHCLLRCPYLLWWHRQLGLPPSTAMAWLTHPRGHQAHTELPLHGPGLTDTANTHFHWAV